MQKANYLKAFATLQEGSERSSAHPEAFLKKELLTKVIVPRMIQARATVWRLVYGPLTDLVLKQLKAHHPGMHKGEWKYAA